MHCKYRWWFWAVCVVALHDYNLTWYSKDKWITYMDHYNNHDMMDSCKWQFMDVKQRCIAISRSVACFVSLVCSDRMLCTMEYTSSISNHSLSDYIKHISIDIDPNMTPLSHTRLKQHTLHYLAIKLFFIWMSDNTWKGVQLRWQHL